MKGMIILDTLHLNVRNPKPDVFRKWYRPVELASVQELRKGIVVDDFVVRTGGNGYKLSIWKGDARAYLSEQDYSAGNEDQCMGIWLQFGPKFLIKNMNCLKPSIHDFIKDIGVIGDWDIRITRIDLAMDLFEIDISNHSLDDWRNNWVGRSKVSKVFFNSRTGNIETINVGSRKSPVYLRIYDKLSQSINEGDILFWIAVWEQGEIHHVTRVEWEVKPKKGGFDELIDFDRLCEWRIVELLNYLVKWGRLCIPSEGQRSRWSDAPFWNLVQAVAKDWADGIGRASPRNPKEFKGVTEAYLRQLAGTISGGMARLSPDDPNFYHLLNGLENEGFPLESIQRAAIDKAARFNRL